MTFSTNGLLHGPGRRPSQGLRGLMGLIISRKTAKNLVVKRKN